MNELVIVIHESGAAKMWKNWSSAEKEIDFRREREKADRCTVAYAASELACFLGKAMPVLNITVAETVPEQGNFIDLTIDGCSVDGAFELQSTGSGIRVTGFGRNGLMNGIYELLRIQGWRWLEPGLYGEVPPENPTLDFLKTTRKCVPSFRHRMIDQYRESDHSSELLKWFSRNRINVVFRKADTGKMADKMGMLSRTGGHLLQKIMTPDAQMDDGRTLWEAHPEWFGLPEDGVRKKATATKIQLCLSNESMLRWLASRICRILETEMKDIDILDLWGFDTWGKCCNCTGCTGLGNGSDQNLYLLSRIHEYLKEHLDRPVMLNTLSYEGTATMDPPEKEIPANLAEFGDMVIFYPINRCYRHLLDDKSCDMNRIYRESMEGWSTHADKVALWSGEYYNVSRYEDLPLVFGKLIPQEMRYYRANGCTGATFMHNISPCWGVRSLTMLLHCQYAWNTETDCDEFMKEYFFRKYSVHAPAMRAVYRYMENAFRDVILFLNQT